MKLLILVCYLLLFAFPFYLFFKRKLNVTLLIFYSFFFLSLLAACAGGGGTTHSIEQIIFGISGFAIAAGIEFAMRHEPTLAVFTTLLLLFFAYSWHYLGSQGAFS